MNALNPQPILASSSDELYNPFSEEARISPHNPHILFEPDPCPINGVHFTIFYNQLRDEYKKTR